MSKAAILYPSAVMALFTLTLLLAMGLRRFAAIQRRTVSIKHYRTYAEGAEPESMRQHSRHVQNHFEVPPLFHLVVWGTYALDQVTPVAVYAAWFFVATRALHSFIHLGSNDVSKRFFVFGLGVMTVAFLWARLLLVL